MHPARAFHVEDRARLLAFFAEHSFVTLCASVGGRPFVAQAPVVVRDLGEDGLFLDFHLSRRNELAPAVVTGFSAIAVASGAHAYVSPDWYGTQDHAPTWNYVSAEAEGFVTPLSDAETVQLLDDLAAQEEALLAPKPAWTRDKLSGARFEGLFKGIVGARLHVERLEGTFKLGQNKSQAERVGVIEALGDHPVADWMRGEG
ncbi:FMN-binding negative transcriptional regulator [Caulobacter endophyticus]|uniref:FMN-binding negative transcriptional regulator n=1 Tax=Caulobacter endophyticus TaxID=2172652 RepID=UPI00240F354D|nr:FMN-binding negative transcriptional regulator [Caulobacter endophyticus]MDG2529286.1 FMN-binding negative transcriptional regulator [Caulobacter endophyticus]